MSYLSGANVKQLIAATKGKPVLKVTPVPKPVAPKPVLPKPVPSTRPPAPIASESMAPTGDVVAVPGMEVSAMEQGDGQASRSPWPILLAGAVLAYWLGRRR